MIGQDERMPATEFLTSDVNKRDIQQLISPGNSKIRTVEVVYSPRLTENTAQTDVANPLCSSANVRGDLSKTYQFDTAQNLASGEVIAANRLNEVCEDNGAKLARIIGKHIDLVDRLVATDTSNALATLSGTWGSGIFTTGNAEGNVNASNEFVMTTLKSGSTTDPNPMAWARLRNALEDIGMPSSVFIVGGRTLREYFQATNAGCCADSGIDVGAMFGTYGYAYAYDKRVAASTALNSQAKAMVLAPGAVQILNFTQAEWKDGVAIPMEAGNYYHGGIVSPRFGLRYDLIMKLDCGELHVNVIATTKAIGLPGDMFATGDEYEGITYANKVLVTNA